MEPPPLGFIAVQESLFNEHANHYQLTGPSWQQARLESLFNEHANHYQLTGPSWQQARLV
ncbi:hypothetical protein PtA15_11A350 [Puccinia triticina]|uniref:Uncharacterized protein n=1 Tax=Puccinia triticina TaxID=208348 RepID=A0ABY7D0W7_9BASI|nr:uncharacterized protein PtA15_11A350 [Puccinia triticina]WAQ89660.1 hypothetical protein PtA15_11A350 [Puccinia triticina]